MVLCLQFSHRKMPLRLGVEWTYIFSMKTEDFERGRRFRAIRESFGETQVQFAKRLGIGPTTVSKYESGRIPTAHVIHYLAEHGFCVNWMAIGAPAIKCPIHKRCFRP